MRMQAYRLFEIVAWPAAAWCAIELVLRGATGSFEGMTWTALTGGMAALTIVACRIRSAQLVAVRLSAGRQR